VVKNITDFGAFVDLSGMDGLLHITDMGWGRVNHPSEVVKVGQELDVMILDIDRDKDRISLGFKQISRNPWDDIERKYPVGSKVKGKVVNLVPYGAFVEIEEGVEGMVHVSEMSWTKRIAKASDALAVGQEVDAVVLNVNRDEQKISLGIRQTEANPWTKVQEKFPIGSRIKGKVRNFTSYGAFVELEPGIDGMIHVSDMSWTRKVNHPSEVLKKGDEVEAVVLEVDASNQRISLGLKQPSRQPTTRTRNSRRRPRRTRPSTAAPRTT
jgi:small subunit ribosomal protein S1